MLIKYILKRLGYTVATLFVLVAATFFMMRLLPGDPFIGEKALPQTTINALNAKYGLDKPLAVQFMMYVGNVCKGDLGLSMNYDNRAVTGIIKQAFPYSCELGLRALIFATIVGVLLGVVSAVKRGSKWDTGAMLISIIGVSIPSFILGALLQYVLGLKLYQWTGIKFFSITGWTDLSTKILPSFALSLGTLAQVSRLMRTSMLDVLGQDYMKTAKSKGLKPSAVIWRHGVRNAIMPIITILGPITASLLTGAFIVENIFSIPGMGKFFVIGVQTQDYTLISGVVLFYGAFLIIANLIVDLLYGVIDPRVKLTK